MTKTVTSYGTCEHINDDYFAFQSKTLFKVNDGHRPLDSNYSCFHFSFDFHNFPTFFDIFFVEEKNGTVKYK